MFDPEHSIKSNVAPPLRGDINLTYDEFEKDV